MDSQIPIDVIVVMVIEFTTRERAKTERVQTFWRFYEKSHTHVQLDNFWSPSLIGQRART